MVAEDTGPGSAERPVTTVARKGTGPSTATNSRVDQTGTITIDWRPAVGGGSLATLTHSTPEGHGDAQNSNTPTPHTHSAPTPHTHSNIDMLNTHAKLEQAISYVEQRYHTPVPTYEESAFYVSLKMPQYVLTIQGFQICFLVDSGATHSIIKKGAFPYRAGVCLSGNYVNSIGASGRIVKERFTVPLRCTDSTKTFKHAFLLSDCCPVNLLGRDLMCRLSVSLVSTPEGVETVKTSDLNAVTLTEHDADQMLHVYLWDLQGGDLNDMLLSKAKTCTSPIHITLHSPCFFWS